MDWLGAGLALLAAGIAVCGYMSGYYCGVEDTEERWSEAAGRAEAAWDRERVEFIQREHERTMEDIAACFGVNR